ncbi:hypothetical protein SAMN05421505_112101 [Sinosporangium album]|uniref:Uncharacterized protein n=1 Tax=Sinosporangium album TaxID=504805 RepID=A0A1G8ACE6_9ACTN|nr:hypothetical protein [Sinosporangium album]SDH18622.1 hypothetical protein SAMN05421505_112101 [Sinosporangium album]
MKEEKISLIVPSVSSDWKQITGKDLDNYGNPVAGAVHRIRESLWSFTVREKRDGTAVIMSNSEEGIHVYECADVLQALQVFVEFLRTLKKSDSTWWKLAEIRTY